MPKRVSKDTANTEHAPTSNGNRELAERALQLALNIRTISGHWSERSAVLSSTAMADDDRFGRRRILDVEAMNDYNRLYKSAVNRVHGEMLQRLRPEDEDLNLRGFYERGFNADSLEMNAADLDRLASLLQSR